MRIRQAAWILALTLPGAVVACSRSNDLVAPAVDLDGNWVVSITNLHDATVRCDMTGLVLTIAQSGNQLTGSYGDGQLTCTDPTGTKSGPWVSGPLVSSKISGSSVDVRLEAPTQQLSGTATTSTMSGAAHFECNCTEGRHSLNGSWTATRQ